MTGRRKGDTTERTARRCNVIHLSESAHAALKEHCTRKKIRMCDFVSSLIVSEVRHGGMR